MVSAAGARTKLHPHVKLAVLDMAGTTVAVNEVVPDALQAAFERAGLSLPAAAIPGMRGRSKEEAIRELVVALAPPGSNVADLSRTIFARFRTILLEKTAAGVTAIPGATATLDWLRSNGTAVVLTTGFDREIAERIVYQIGWGPASISGLVTADDVARGRPDPDLVLEAMKVAGVTEPAEVVVVGDTAADLQAAWRAGVRRIVGVLSGAHSRNQLSEHPHAVILNSVADLPSWLRAGAPTDAS